jgi:predicted PurR-regulated permease PerM
MISVPAFAVRMLVALGLVALMVALWKALPVLILAFGGAVLAAVLRAASHPLEKRFRLGSSKAVAIVVVVLVAVAGSGLYFFGAQVAKQADQFRDTATKSWERAQERLASSPLGARIVDMAKDASGSDVASHVAKSTVTVFGAAADLLLVLMLAVYLAADPRTYRDGFLALVPAPGRARVGTALDGAGRALHRWLLGQLVAMVSVGVAIGIAMALLGVPMAPALGVISGLLEFVPVIGPILGCVPGILIAFAQDPQLALYAALVYAGVLFAEGNVIIPLVQKWAVELPPALGLVGIVAFGTMFGVAGALFAMPLLVVCVTLVQVLYLDHPPKM